MQRFAQLVAQLDETSSTQKKVQYLVDYFHDCEPKDAIWTVALFTGRRPKKHLNTRQLAIWACEFANLPMWLFEESYAVVGDLAETLDLLLPASKQKLEKPLHVYIELLKSWENLDEMAKKAEIMRIWQYIPKFQLFIFHKLITGGFRLGVSQNLIFQAIAHIHQQPVAKVSHAFSGNWNPESTTIDELLSGNNDFSKPYPFSLAYPLENEPAHLGTPDEWFAEWKWDGIRIQLILRNSEIFLWSRGDELVTDKFPELNELTNFLPNGVCIDGELLCMRNGRPLPFSLLQTRIGRKTLSKKILTDAPVAVMAYDLLEYDYDDIRSWPMHQRRAKLVELLSQINQSNLIHISHLIEFHNWGELGAVRLLSREHDAEGLMLKRKSSPYHSGRKRGDWWKWKIEPFAIDAVMIYAQRGHGRRADLYSDFTFAVWDNGKLVPFAKAYSGLTDKEMLEITRFVQDNTIEKFGPVRSVPPVHVFELHFEGINQSSRHKSGIAVRFPRIHRWRKDKPASEANTLADLKALTK